MEEDIGTLTCPKCGHKQKMEIPKDKCIPFYRCDGCGKMISAKESCCVFCDYADKPCPVGHKTNKMNNKLKKSEIKKG